MNYSLVYSTQSMLRRLCVCVVYGRLELLAEL